MYVTDDIFKGIIFSNKKQLKILLDKYNNFQNNIKVINVVGTNGKGSVSTYLAKQLKSHYNKVGLFVSPAFIQHNERIQINNNNISDQKIKHYLNFFAKDIKKIKLNFFELWTLICMRYFYDEKVDIAIIEAGIGGKKDCTTLFQNQLLVALTSIGYDHVEILGNSISEIIDNKVNIRKEENPIFLANSNRKYIKYFKKYDNIIFSSKYLNAIDLFQKDNIGLVIKIMKYLNLKINFSIFENSPLIGRFSIIKKNPYLILDGAHNELGINVLIKNIKKNKIKKPIIIFSSSKNKNYKKYLNNLNKKFDLYITNFKHFKSWKIDKEMIKKYKSINNIKDFILENKDRNIIVCGSIYFISFVYEELLKN